MPNVNAWVSFSYMDAIGAMTKARAVTKLPPRHLRFKDDRIDTRCEIRHYPEARKQAREFARKHAAYYKALRMDQRFAAPLLLERLRAAATEMHYAAYGLCYRPLLNHANHLPWFSHWHEVPGVGGQLRPLTSAHVSLMDPTKIACYPTRADAERGREVVMSPGKFFTNVRADLMPSEIQRLVETYLQTQAPPPVFFIDNDEYLPEDADALGNEWARVYASARGFSSCMVGFGTGPDAPVRFYALPNNGLSLAYMTHNNEPDGDVVARTICNQGNQTYVRIYGDARLAKALESSPHDMNYDPNGTLVGVKCRRIPKGRTFLAPFIDGGVGINVLDNNTCILVKQDNARYPGDTTTGYAEGGDTMCECCEEHFDEDEMHFSAYHDEWLCQNCVDNEYYYAIYTRHRDATMIHSDNVVHIGNDAYLNDEDLLDTLGFVYIENAEEWARRDDAVYLNYLTEWVRLDDVVCLDVDTSSGDSYALDNDTKVIVLEGEELTVFKDYDGPTDEDKEEESDEIECVIERKLATA